MTMTIKTTAASLFSLLLLSGCFESGSGSGDVSGDSGIPVNPTTVAEDLPTPNEDETEELVEQDTNPDTDELDQQLGQAGICSTEGINAWVDAQMRDYYIFADQVPVVDPSEYENPSALLADLRVHPDIFSSISPLASRTALFEEGETFGFGFLWRRDQAGALRFVNIVSGSPLDNTDVLRGDRIIAINGVPELNITDEMFGEIFGEINVPTTVTFTIERDGTTQDINVTSGVYAMNTVANVQTFDYNGATVGYIESSIFLRTSEAELDSAVTQLINANPTDVILDFRYNGGGFVFVAQKFAAQIAGSAFAGEVFQNTEFNERYTRFNQASFLEEQELNLNLPRVIILTTANTASASEAIANNLSPYIDVVVIGSQTAGKPFASIANPNCEHALNAMDRITRNNIGETVLGGITPTCLVQDEFLHPMFSSEDALFSAALTYLDTNTCPSNDPLASGQLEIRANILNAPIDSYIDLDMPTGLMLQ